MARCLIVGCGCRGLELAGALRAEGHAVRGTTRWVARADELRAAGVEPVVGDPDRMGTIAPAFAHVAVTCLLLGSVTGPPETVEALHSTRLDMLMEKMIDTTSRGVVYEAVGTVDAELLAAGAERVRWWCERSLIPYALIDRAPDGDWESWTATAAGAVGGVLHSGR